MNIVEFPGASVLSIANGLRALADAIEAGDTVDNVVYVVDKGDGNIDVGLLGGAPHPATTAHFLLAVGQLKMVRGALDD